MAKQKEPVKRYIESITVRPDGKTEYTFNTGGIVIVPPLPASQAWRDRVARELSDINYRIIRRMMAEKEAE